MTYIFIAHGLNVINYISDKIIVMYLGRIVEVGEADDIFHNPKHPYTEALMSAIPVPIHLKTKMKKKRIRLEGSIPSPADPPTGCYFHPRCRYATEKCKSVEYTLFDVNKKKRTSDSV